MRGWGQVCRGRVWGQESILSLHLSKGRKDRLQVLGLVRKHPYPLSHLTSPFLFYVQSRTLDSQLLPSIKGN